MSSHENHQIAFGVIFSFRPEKTPNEWQISEHWNLILNVLNVLPN